MGESIVAALRDVDKMGETATVTNPALEVSVSFGRFENDSLSWEKWSSFSPNKYLEEVEKCATPGSVAQKKAYFEAHYKKIAARKAELQDQEKQVEIGSSSAHDQENGDLMVKTCGDYSVFDESNVQTSSEEFREEPKWDTGLGGDSVFDESNIQTSLEKFREEPKWDTGLSGDYVDEPNEDAAINMEGQEALVVRATEQMGSRSESLMLNQLEEAGLVKEQETSFVESEDIEEEVVVVKELEIPSSVVSKNKEELPKKFGKELECTPVVREKNGKLDRHKTSEKVTPISKIRDIASVKKKSPATKTSQISTKKSAKPVVPATRTTQTSSPLSASRPSAKKVTNALLPRSKISSGGESKRVAPKSLHMSLSVDTKDTLTPTTTRKSFIMEKMSDKEIVKRAFKTFQNSFNQLKPSAEERSSGAKQAPNKGMAVMVSTSTAPRKENGGSPKPGFVDKITAKAAPSFSGMKSDERAEKNKEFHKKLDGKSITKGAESTLLPTKTKGAKAVENKKLRQSLNLPGVYRGAKVSKGPLEKEGSKTLRI